MRAGKLFFPLLGSSSGGVSLVSDNVWTGQNTFGQPLLGSNGSAGLALDLSNSQFTYSNVPILEIENVVFPFVPLVDGNGNGFSIDLSTGELSQNESLAFTWGQDQVSLNVPVTMNGNVLDMGGGAIQDVADPVAGQDAVTLQWTAAHLQSIISHQSSTLVGGTKTLTVASGATAWVQNTNTSALTNIGELSVSISGTTATIKSTNALDTSTFTLFSF